MYRKLLSVSLVSVISLSLVAPGFAADPKPKAASSAKVHTLQLSGMQLKGEEIDYKVQRDGKHSIILCGQAGLKIDEIVMTADLIQATYSKIETMVLDLKGNVEIASKGDKLRATSLEAKFDFGANLLTLKGDEKQEAVLIRYSVAKTTQMDAAEIQIQFQDQNTMLIKSQGPVELSERKPAKGDGFYRPAGQYDPQNTFGTPQDNQFGPSPFSNNRTEANPFPSPKTDIFSPPNKS